MTKIQQKLINIVESLNLQCYESLNSGINIIDDMIPFEFQSSGHAYYVLFLNQVIWHSEDDSRWDENDNEVDFEKTIKNRANGIIGNINKFKL